MFPGNIEYDSHKENRSFVLNNNESETFFRSLSKKFFFILWKTPCSYLFAAGDTLGDRQRDVRKVRDLEKPRY